MTKNRRHDIVKPSKFKTSLCSFFLTAEGCPFGDKCAFAHGEAELRPEVPTEVEPNEGGGTEADTRRTGAATPTSPDSDLIRSGAAVSHGHKTGKTGGAKRGPQTGIVLNNNARNVTAGTVSAASNRGTKNGVTPTPLPAPAGAFFGAALAQPPYAPYYAAPPGVSHVPFMALNNQVPINTIGATGPVGFDASNAAAYGLMPQLFTGAMAPLPPPPPPATHKPSSTPGHRVPVVSSNTIAPAGLHRQGMAHLASQNAAYAGQAFAHGSSLAPSFIMLPFTNQGQPTSPPPRTAPAEVGPEGRPTGTLGGAARVPPSASDKPVTAGRANAGSSGMASGTAAASHPATPPTSSWSDGDGTRLSFQSLMASAAPPTVVHIPLGGQPAGRNTPPSGVADAVGSWPSNAAATRYYMSHETQTADKTGATSSLFPHMGSGIAGGSVRDGDGSHQFGAVGAASAAEGDDDGVDWGAVLENWTRHQMQEEEAANGAKDSTPTTQTPVLAPANGTLTVKQPASFEMPVMAPRLTPVALSLNKPFISVNKANAATGTTGTPATAQSATPAHAATTTAATTPSETTPKQTGEKAAKKKSLLCSVVRGAHTAGISAAADSGSAAKTDGVHAETDDQPVLLYNPQRNTIYYITRNGKTRLAVGGLDSPHTTAAAATGTVDPLTTSGPAEEAEGGGKVAPPSSHDSSQSEPGQSCPESNTPKADPLAQQSFRCRPGKKKFLVMGEADSDDEAEYCI